MRMEIRHGLEQKLEAMVRHEWYAKVQDCPTPEEREAARQRYLDERGVPSEFPVDNFSLGEITGACHAPVNGK